MIKEGVNKYDPKVVKKSAAQRLIKKLGEEKKKSKPCIFLSHISSDIEPAIEIGKYIRAAGIDIYLDIEDRDLQRADENSDHKQVTEFIEAGINASTDLLIILSDSTRQSWWVPFEIGFAKRDKLSIRTLPLKDVELPSYLEIVKSIQGYGSLDDYLADVAGKVYSGDELNTLLVELNFGKSNLQKLAGMHPLRRYLADA